MSYITKEELTSHIYEENMNVISRDNDDQVTAAISAAVSEAKGYLSRFDTAALFGRAGDERDPILMLFLKDMAKWHFLAVCNAGSDLTVAEDRYSKALKWLDKVQSGRTVPLGWPYPEGEGLPVSNFIVNSNPKRNNRY